MVCVSCGTQIADRAIVCYRCGTPTAMPVPSAVKPPVRRAGPWPWVLTGAAVVFGGAAAWLPADSAWDLPAAIGAGAAVVGAVTAWWRGR